MSEHAVKYLPSDVPGELGKPFRKALSWATKQHAGQHRKAKPDVPYVSHLLGVASLVLEAGGTETEAIAAPTAPRDASDWHERKSIYLEKLRHEEDRSVLLVSGADKLYNARAIVADLRSETPAWTPFNAPPLDQLSYYTSLRDALCDRLPRHLGRELRCAVDEIVALTNLEVESAAWREAHPEAGPCDN